jgi:hypothetical protein
MREQIRTNNCDFEFITFIFEKIQQNEQCQLMKKNKLLEKTSKGCLKNAKQYFKDAEILCSFRSYGHALGFTILGDVKMGKSAIYNLYSKNLIPVSNLPEPYSTYCRENEIEKFAAESWWIGFVLASNIEEIIQNLIEVTQEVKIDSSKEFGLRLTKKGTQIQKKLIQKLLLENEKIRELEEYKTKAFLVKPNFWTITVDSPNLVKKSVVKQRLKIAKKRIKTAEPFLNFPINSVQQSLTKMLLTIAFHSILPIKKEITHFIIPSTINYVYEK